MNQFFIGIFITVLGGFLQGSFALFMKNLKSWRWENFWLIFSIVGLFIFPLTWSIAVMPNILDVFSSLGLTTLALPLLFGALWGVGSVLFGLSVEKIGMAMSFTIVVGLSSAIGTITPLFFNQQLPTVGTLVILGTGLILMIAGIILSGFAGGLREKISANIKTSGLYVSGLVMAVVSGVVSPMNNIGFAYGKNIARLAESFGASSASASLFALSVVIFGGFFVNLCYAIYLLDKNRSWQLFQLKEKMPPLGSVVAGLFWFGGIGLYGIATTYLGTLGTSAGYAIFTGSIIVAGSFWGILSGEWRGMRRPMLLQLISSFVVIIGIVVVSLAIGV